MSIRIMTAVWGIRLPDSEKIVLLALADCANDEGVCWPSMRSLAEKCSKSDRTVQAAIKALVEAGHLSRIERAGRGVLYTVHVRAVPRNLFAPEATSPPKPLRPEISSPPKAAQPTPEAASDKPSRTSIPLEISDEISPPVSSSDEVAGEPPLTAEEILEAWNATADKFGLPKARLTPQRRRKLGPLIRQYSLQDFTEAIRAIERSPFLRGDNNRAWRADFDFFLQPTSFNRLIEGSYDRSL